MTFFQRNLSLGTGQEVLSPNEQYANKIKNNQLGIN